MGFVVVVCLFLYRENLKGYCDLRDIDSNVCLGTVEYTRLKLLHIRLFFLLSVFVQMFASVFQ